MEQHLTIDELKNAFVNNTHVIFTKQYDDYEVKKTGLISKILIDKIDDFVNDYIIYVQIEPKIFYNVIFSGAKFYIEP
jgi:hypothetical protein